MSALLTIYTSIGECTTLRMSNIMKINVIYIHSIQIKRNCETFFVLFTIQYVCLKHLGLLFYPI